MKVLIENEFHSTSMEFIIKEEYADDPLMMLEYEVHNYGVDRKYAQGKLRQIKGELCGCKECKCVNSVVTITGVIGEGSGTPWNA